MAAPDAPWVDSPFHLIPTPGRGEEVSKLPVHIWIAREMACAHNGMLRGLNSIYQQSIHVANPEDIKDLLKYTEFWCGWIHEHHDAEEDFYFPEVERLTGVKGLMAANVAQHHAFMPGLEALGKFAKETTVEEYDGTRLRAVIDSFGKVLTEHLIDEIETLLELEKYDGVVMKKLYQELDLKVRAGDKVGCLFKLDEVKLTRIVDSVPDGSWHLR
ncbi:hypothetical protein ONS95_008139 [Cadophora gregata]|uniref:uncharacterized protein n=1 Tax=Cadophora gregata TaxID=51156 RepID=UPI0026DC40C4|nr:uncharacterized protein ONS95_008139 [Cadophora gregata]KAK0119292.1 hypothetical protein ONS96_012350 [Cadophora gregata f. sp. sojae]KAK0126546.1 hypothetical protein ONS95_008139 [Cadophora gregata]